MHLTIGLPGLSGNSWELGILPYTISFNSNNKERQNKAKKKNFYLLLPWFALQLFYCTSQSFSQILSLCTLLSYFSIVHFPEFSSISTVLYAGNIKVNNPSYYNISTRDTGRHKGYSLMVTIKFSFLKLC